jgi:hypothetical protein
MKMRSLLVGIIGTGLLMLTPDVVAHGGAGGGNGHGGGSSAGHGGGSWAGRGGGPWGGHGHGVWAGRGGSPWAGRGGGAWAGHGHVAWGGHGHGFNHGRRFFAPGFGFFGYGYPWWWDGYYPYYPSYSYYPYPYYGDPYYGSEYYGNTYYGNPYYENRDPRSSPARALQTTLAQRGYYRGSIDGVWGPETRSAIRSFQAHQGLPVTGQVDGKLIRALRS